MIGELVISGVIYSHIDQMDTYTSNLSLESMKQYNISDPKDTITERWDFVQNNVTDNCLFLIFQYKIFG